jgi:ankyrin repeat protein
MTKTISIFLKNFILAIIFLGNINSYSLSSKTIPQSATRVPADSFIVLSVNTDALLNKSKITKSRNWKPLFDSWNLSDPEVYSFFFNLNDKGLNTKIPLQFFIRTDSSDQIPWSIGIVGVAKEVQKIDQSIANIAESLGFTSLEGKTTRFQKKGIPLEFGRKGRFLYLIGLGPIMKNVTGNVLSLEKLHKAIPSQSIDNKFPTSMKQFFTTKSDIGLYLDGSGFANLLDKSWPNDRWKKLLPLMDPIFSRQFGVHLLSNIGSIKITSREYITGKKKSQPPAKELDLLDSIPGDSPLVARLSLPTQELRQSLTDGVDQFLLALSNDQINKDSKLPGFDTTATELLSSPNGDFVLAGGLFKEKNSYQANGQLKTSLHPKLVLGIGIEKQFALKQLLAGLNTANSLRSILDMHDLHISELGKQLWLSSIDYLREVREKKPLKRLSKSRLNFLNANNFALELNINQANHDIRKSSFLSFDQFKLLNVADDFQKLSMYIDEGALVTNIKLNNKKRSGWNVLAEHIGQTLIDQINGPIFQAISQNNLNSVIQSVQGGALINTTDRFGHSPMHYAAYKGNPRIVDYLLNNGGDPNIRGRHDSTPLHSAAWGRNIQVLELLLEDGAEVDARTDEGETPGMTAALRGEKDMLEILFALSADPHATDIHGTNLVDLAAAGGHKSIVELLQQIGVSNKNPLHVAAGLGDLNKIKRLLNNGHSVNERDTFGATPLLVAMVAGKEEVVDFLLSQNANPLLEAKDGYTIMHGAAFSGKKSLVRKALSYDLDVNSRYGPDGITPVDVAEENGDALPFLRALGGKTAWELGRIFPKE